MPKFNVLVRLRLNQFAKSHEKFELVSSSLSNVRNTGLKTRRYIRMISRQSKSKFNFIPRLSK